MSYDPNGSDWSFEDPDWLAELMAEAEEEPAPAPKPAPAEDFSRQQPSPTAEQRRTVRPSGPAAQPEPAPARPGTPPADWERTRRSHSARKKSGTAARRTSAVRRHRRANIPIILLVILLAGGMLFSAWKLSTYLLSYSRDRSAYNDLAANALSGFNDPETPDAIVSQPEAVPELSDTAPAVSEIPFQVDWDYLSSLNSDIVGWLYCPDTIINYPVVQSPDHNYYLNHGFEGESNAAGTLFADRDSVAGVTQSNLIIYGHNMKDESMFGTLKSYVDMSYYDKHPVFYYLTPTQSYRLELLCAHIVDAKDENFPTYFSSSQAQQNYINTITSEAFWVNSDAATSAYQLITFSTCTSSAGQNDPRFLVHGIMIPIQ